ncbi:DeoR/GlpR family DNA-binding transcription regulator [Herbiconiux sp. P17]|uniref:DeoR/GlpR family DNA-binding transcription regulator n=1 Tax=Herbiconiux wuyangfengii TaxID=3342794 RepID=UPI0035B7F1BE
MLTAERHEWLLAELARDGRLLAKEAAAKLGVTEDSIRRDLRTLAEAGLLQRVYGGALPASPATKAHAERFAVAVDSKQRVARAAVQLLRPGTSLLLDAGTTALEVAKALPHDLPLTVMTPSPIVAIALAEHPLVEIVLIGGTLSRHSMVSSGSLAAEALRRVRADVCFLGVTAVHPETGLTTGSLDDAAIKRAMAAQSAETYVLASAEKIGAASAFPVLDFADVTGLVLDPASPLDPAVAAALARAGARLVG